jgi:multicomponent Na+:H+ antiporter subunit E
MKRLLQLSLPLFAAYLVLTNNFQFSNLVLGALVALGLAALMPSGDLPPFSLRRLPRMLWGLLLYVWIVGWDVLRGAYSTARIVLTPKKELPLDVGILAVPSGTKTELGTALSAHAITLSPGEMVLAMDEQGTMYVHCLNVTESAKTIEAMQAKRKHSISLMFE